MASNPRIPEQNPKNLTQRRGPVLVPKSEPPTSAVPGVVLAIVTAVLLLGAIFYFMPRAPKAGMAPAGAVTPAQPAGSQLAISGVKMSVAPTGGAINLDGQLTNSSPNAVNGVMAEINFKLKNGQLASIQRPVQGIAVGKPSNEGKHADTGKVTGDTEDLTKAPIRPNETRPVRITVDQVPATWNHEIPQVRIVETTGQ